MKSRRTTSKELQGNAPFPWELDAAIGDHIEVIEIIGSGGMATVYRAWHRQLRREVGVKVLPKEDLQENPALETYFREQARAMARLDHENIIKVHDISETFRGDLYLVMEYVQGYNLAELISGGGLDLTHAQSWIPQVGVALEYAHQLGILHCDIKPGNILITREGKAVVTDFGLVKRTNSPQQSASEVLGTAPYAAPELPGVPTPQSDIYSLGAVLYEMVAGRAPGPDCGPPSQIVPSLPSQLDQIVVRAMQRKSIRRYANALEMVDDILEIGSLPSSSEKKQTSTVVLPVKRSGPRSKQHPWAWAWLRWAGAGRRS